MNRVTLSCICATILLGAPVDCGAAPCSGQITDGMYTRFSDKAQTVVRTLSPQNLNAIINQEGDSDFKDLPSLVSHSLCPFSFIDSARVSDQVADLVSDREWVLVANSLYQALMFKMQPSVFSGTKHRLEEFIRKLKSGGAEESRVLALSGQVLEIEEAVSSAKTNLDYAQRAQTGILFDAIQTQ